jgi:carboxypeptidase PM20D1
MAEGSHVANVIPVTAQATVNVRLLPGESTELVAAWMHRIIRDKDIKIEVIAESERSRPSSVDSEPFQAISEAIIRTFPEAIPTPYMMMGATDALQYELVSDYVYRFTPALMNTQEVQRMHNIDERFSLENLGKAAQFYTTLIKQDSLREDM